MLPSARIVAPRPVHASARRLQLPLYKFGGRKELSLTLRNLLIATAVLGIVFGLAYLLVPEQVMQLFGSHTDASGYLAARFFGGATIGLGIIFLPFAAAFTYFQFGNPAARR